MKRFNQEVEKSLNALVTIMDLQSSDAILIKSPIQTMFKGMAFTINPHFMLSDLKPFIIFAPIQ